MTFQMDLDSYVDVAERERLLFERYPDARVRVDLDEVRNASGELVGWKAKATVWRSPEDTLPVWDWAVEPVPGKTPFTRDSEAMNASTSAVGRAIVLAGFETKKIASADELRNRQAGVLAGSTSFAGTASTFVNPAESAQAAQPPAEPNDNPYNELIGFGKHKGTTVGDLPSNYRNWLASPAFDPKTPDGHRAKAAARAVLGREFIGAGAGGTMPSDEIPFGPSVV